MKPVAAPLTLAAPAKINLRLKILGRRPDGYHELAMLNTLLDCCDTVTLRPRPRPAGSGIRIRCRHPEVPADATNLAYRAAQALLERLPEPRPGVVISIRKRIPVQAGLGGGSSDAAAVLAGLVRLYNLRISKEKLAAIGLALGADVPFFLHGRTAWVEGIGERIRPFPRLPDYRYLLVKPPFGVSTAWAFSHWNPALTKRNKTSIIRPSGVPRSGNLSAWLENDLEAAVIPRHPLVGELKRELVSRGALAAVMSGSGPTVVGVFATDAEAARAGRSLKKNYPACRMIRARGGDWHRTSA